MTTTRIRKIPERLWATYAETIELLHHLSIAHESSALPSPLITASVVAAIYGREIVEVFDDLKRGMVA